MVSQLGYLIFSDNHYGIFVLSDLSSNVVRDLFRNCAYIVSESFLFLIVPLPEDDKELCLVFPLNKIKQYPFYLSIFLFSDTFSEAECVAIFHFTERDIGEAQGYYRATVQLTKSENSSTEPEGLKDQIQ